MATVNSILPLLTLSLEQGQSKAEQKAEQKIDKADHNSFKKLWGEKKIEKENSLSETKEPKEFNSKNLSYLKLPAGLVKKTYEMLNPKSQQKIVKAKETNQSLAKQPVLKQPGESRVCSKKEESKQAEVLSSHVFQPALQNRHPVKKITNEKPLLSESAAAPLKRSERQTRPENPKIVIVDLRSEERLSTKKTLKDNFKPQVSKATRPSQPSYKANSDPQENMIPKVFVKLGEENIVQNKNNLHIERTVATATFENKLAELAKQEILKHAAIVVKDGGNGEIQLLLKPESLGSVRVKLNIEDNNIVGRIIVDNSNVKQIMEQNLADLENALKDNGYQNPSFEVFIAGQGADGKKEKHDLAQSELVVRGLELKNESYSEYERATLALYSEAEINIIC